MTRPFFSLLLVPLAACALSHELADAPLDSSVVSDTGVTPDASLECVAPQRRISAGLAGAEGSGVVSSIDGRTVVVTISDDVDSVFTWVAGDLPSSLALGDLATVTRDGTWSTLTTDRIRMNVYDEIGFVPRQGLTTTSPSNGPFSLVERCRGASSGARCGGPIVYDLAFRDSVRLGAGERAPTGCDGGGEIIFPGATQYPGCTLDEDGLIVNVEASFQWTFGISCGDDSVAVD